ncbi:MAG TPA: hypothetical protein VGJ75_24220 [Dongiaceae bacterium]|jgi:hypothetical protein
MGLRRSSLGLSCVLLAWAIAGSAQAQQTGLQPDGRLIITGAANGEIQQYVERVAGRFGALAVSQDGAKAVSYICNSRLWKNCDEPGGDESNLAIPSGRVARDAALTRCRDQSGAACILLFINDDQQRDFDVQP